jgi:hypothetical protein
MSIAKSYEIGAYLEKPMVGESISEVAERAVSLANTKKVTTFFEFNSWLIVVSPNATVDEIFLSYDKKTSTSNVKVYYVKGMVPLGEDDDLIWLDFSNVAKKAVWCSGMWQGTVWFVHMNKLVVVGLGSTVREVLNL